MLALLIMRAARHAGLGRLVCLVSWHDRLPGIAYPDSNGSFRDRQHGAIVPDEQSHGGGYRGSQLCGLLRAMRPLERRSAKIVYLGPKLIK